MDLDKNNFLFALSRLFVFSVTMNAQNAYHWLYKHALSDGDATPILHMHCGMICRHPINKHL